MNRNNKNVVRLTESKLRNLIKETVSEILNEVASYKDTMQKSDKKFNNGFAGKINQKLFPRKYQQYQNIKQRANNIASQAQSNFDKEYADVEWTEKDSLRRIPNYHNYAVKRGLVAPCKDKPFPAIEYDSNGYIKATPNGKAYSEWFHNANYLGGQHYDNVTKPDIEKIKKYGR